MSDIFDFENADIGRLAIHLRETLDLPEVQAFTVQGLGNPPTTLISATGYLVGFALNNASATAGLVTFSDGSLFEVQLLWAESISGFGSLSRALPGRGFPFFTSLILADELGGTTFNGQVFYTRHKPR